MAGLRFDASLSVVTTPAPDDDSGFMGDTLTPRQEAFAHAWARTSSKAAAYRLAYTVHPRTLPNVVWVASSRVAALPGVQKRYRELLQLAALETIISAREFFQWHVDVATADPAEIVRVVVRCCRNCYGTSFGYQWRDDVEYMEACITAIDTKKPPPSDAGGYGFNGHLEPNPLCPHCYGSGITETVITDSSKLEGKARKLYAGAEQDRWGMVKVKLHDQQKAADMVGRMLGVFKDADLRSPAERDQETRASRVLDNITEENADRAYLSLVKT